MYLNETFQSGFQTQLSWTLKDSSGEELTNAQQLKIHEEKADEN